MKKTLVSLILPVIFGLSAHAWAPRLSGTMMPIELSQFDTVVPWDTSQMTPVHVEYVARHGARYLSSEKKVTKLRNFLEKADERGELTESGDAMLRLIGRIDSLSAGRWGALSSLGESEEVVLAQRLWKDLPQLLRSSRIDAKSTYVPRVVMTMYEFCHELSRCSNRMEISTAEGRQFNSLLRFFDTDSAYVAYLSAGPWRREYKLYATATLPKGPAARMVSGKESSATLKNMSLDAYGILQGLTAMGINDVDVSRWFSLGEWESCWRVSNLEHYYERSANPYSDLPEKSARVLWERMLADIDTAFAGGDVADACMWFGHAETVIPLFSLLDLPGCRAATCTAAQVADHWVDSYVSPLGANLAIVCLRDREGGEWLAMCLNGRWIEREGERVFPYSSISTSKSSAKRSSLSPDDAIPNSSSLSAAMGLSSVSEMTVS